MPNIDINFTFSENEQVHRDVLRVFRFLAHNARPPVGGYDAETEWLRKTHEGAHTSKDDIAGVTGSDASSVQIALDALENAGFLSVKQSEDEATYALKRAWSRLLLDVEKHGWTREGKTLRDAVMAGEKWANTTNFWGNWELHSEGYIVTKELTYGFDNQASRGTEKGLEALKVLQVLYPIESTLSAAA